MRTARFRDFRWRTHGHCHCAPDLRYDNLFFSGMATVALVVVLIGFARTYFLAGLFRAPLPNLLVHIHGAAFTLWITLFITQISLVTARRVISIVVSALTTRLRRPDLGHLETEVTFDDPGAFTKPLKMKTISDLAENEDVQEWICNENNQDVEHLVGR